MRSTASKRGSKSARVADARPASNYGTAASRQIAAELRKVLEMVFRAQFEASDRAQEIRELGAQQLVRANRRSITEDSVLARTCLELLRSVDPAPFPEVPDQQQCAKHQAVMAQY